MLILIIKSGINDKEHKIIPITAIFHLFDFRPLIPQNNPKALISKAIPEITAIAVFSMKSLPVFKYPIVTYEV
jgi:hypothetical protein